MVGGISLIWAIPIEVCQQSEASPAVVRWRGVKTLNLNLNLNLDPVALIEYLDRKLEARRLRKFQARCRHSWMLKLNHPYFWCARCQKWAPTESVMLLARAGGIRI